MDGVEDKFMLEYRKILLDEIDNSCNDPNVAADMIAAIVSERCSGFRWRANRIS